MEEKIIEGLGILWNIFVLSLLVITFSMLIITIIPAILAAISVLKQSKGKKLSDLNIRIRTFWRSFNKHLYQGIAIQLAATVVLFIAYINLNLIWQSNGRIETLLGFSITIIFCLITGMFLLNLMYGITLKRLSRKLLEHCLLLVFAKLPIMILLFLSYLIVFLSIFLLPQAMILTVGILILLHFKVGTKIWVAIEPV